ncbi:type IV secretory system conjugative DNA transfer family protein [Aquamicrobium sp.]|uniref:type IV secretory system conjugative DNA transfer family protein n=1 Tax=Aquamicrobium sp. TaxID=1872579 RepID=UPI00258F4B7A|nr:type IV secretory system conjugative DNA transfer family protein [Aquamicrobium sp.]MCK9550441.1 type IV secretory system conjugative DNA transfer family protein [Aquamicrobium sp.]
MSTHKDTGKRVIFLSFLFILLIVTLLIINQIATQYVAAAFGYDIALGKPIFGHIYEPFHWIIWIFQFGSTNKQFFNLVIIKAGVAMIGVIIFFVVMKLLLYRQAKSYDDVHGSAHWATKKEIEKMGLINQQKGVYIGAWQDPKTNTIKYLKHNGPEHILAFAPTRSGKGIGLVIPTLLAWEGSCVVLDIKGENWELTAGYRKSIGNKVLRFDPVSQTGGVGYNPLEEIRLNSIYTVSDVQNIASIVIDPDGKGLDDHWAKTGYALLTTMILHLVYKAQKEGFTPSLAQLRGLINDPEKDNVKEVLNEWIEYKHYQDENREWITDPVVAVGAKEAANKDERELSSVVSTVVSNLSLYDDPILKKNISDSDFKIKDLMGYAEENNPPVSLYLVIKPSDMNRLRPLVRIILNQILTILVGDMKFEAGQQKVEYANRLLLMLDEFTSLGKLPLFETALAYMAGYGMKAYIIVQDLTQLYKAYSKDEAIISNSHVRIAYAPNKVETAELLSKMTGTTTVVKTVRTTSGGRGSVVLGQVSENYQEVQRPLMTVDECMQLPAPIKDNAGKVKVPGDMLVFIAGNPTIYGKQILYFLDPIFSKRSKIAAPEKSDSLREKIDE